MKANDYKELYKVRKENSILKSKVNELENKIEELEFYIKHGRFIKHYKNIEYEKGKFAFIQFYKFRINKNRNIIKNKEQV